VDTVIRTRVMRAFMAVLPAFVDGLGLHDRSSSTGLRARENTKTDQIHGRSGAQVAQLHPKCPFQVGLRRVRALNIASQYGSTKKWPDYRYAGLVRSIRHLTYPYKDSSDGGSIPRDSRSHAE
jgi:hypothetical protein